MGNEFVVPRDLPIGSWHWRLRSRVGEVVGATNSPVWNFSVVHQLAHPGPTRTGIDFNGDGYRDLLAGAPGSNTAYVFYGGSDGFPDSPTLLVGEGRFGNAATSAGDINGDGFTDALVGAPGQAKVHVYFGSTGGLPAAASVTLAGVRGSLFGTAVTGVGDVNGDGYGDIVVGAPARRSAFLYSGSPNGLTTVPTMTWTQPYGLSGVEFGRRIVGGADFNGDGYSDFVIAAFYRGHAYLGGPDGPSRSAATMIGGEYPAGVDIAVAGDVNGDGYSDLAYGFDTGFSSGATHPALVALGASTGFQVPRVRIPSPARTTWFGSELLGPGDVDGDGIDDLVVAGSRAVFLCRGAPEGTQRPPPVPLPVPQNALYWGAALGAAGDLNCDGLADLAVGDNGRSELLIYRGSSLGLEGPRERLRGMPGSYFGFAVNR